MFNPLVPDWHTPLRAGLMRELAPDQFHAVKLLLPEFPGYAIRAIVVTEGSQYRAFVLPDWMRDLPAHLQQEGVTVLALWGNESFGDIPVIYYGDLWFVHIETRVEWHATADSFYSAYSVFKHEREQARRVKRVLYTLKLDTCVEDNPMREIATWESREIVS